MPVAQKFISAAMCLLGLLFAGLAAAAILPALVCIPAGGILGLGLGCWLQPQGPNRPVKICGCKHAKVWETRPDGSCVWCHRPTKQSKQRDQPGGILRSSSSVVCRCTGDHPPKLGNPAYCSCCGRLRAARVELSPYDAPESAADPLAPYAFEIARLEKLHAAGSLRSLAFIEQVEALGAKPPESDFYAEERRRIAENLNLYRAPTNTDRPMVLEAGLRVDAANQDLKRFQRSRQIGDRQSANRHLDSAYKCVEGLDVQEIRNWCGLVGFYLDR